MKIVPFQVGPDSCNVFVILEDDNIERMKQYDPAQVALAKLPPVWQRLRVDTIIVGYANAQDLERVRSLMQTGEGASALSYLSRGFKFKPASGDHDAPYRS